jgi:hypothetical protein
MALNKMNVVFTAKPPSFAKSNEFVIDKFSSLLTFQAAKRFEKFALQILSKKPLWCFLTVWSRLLLFAVGKTG